MSFKQSSKCNLNYAAQIIQISNIKPHENADRLKIITVQGNDIITGHPFQLDDICIYFPLECTISKKYLSFSNSFEKKEDNANQEIKGFFGKHGRCKAIKLRGKSSFGYLIPVKSLQDWLEHEQQKTLNINWFELVGTEFDYYNDIFICKKYTSIQERSQQQQKERGQKKAEEIVKHSKLVENQFKLHIDTPQLGKNINTVLPNDLISITAKWHGSSHVSSRILVKQQLRWYEKLLIKLGINLVTTAYGNIYSSRKVIKNKWFDEKQNNKVAQSGYYKGDIWGIVNKELKDYLEEGMTLYGEIVGYLPEGSFIQKDYDYKCEIGQHKFAIYRITTTTPNGNVIEWNMNEIQEWTKQKGLLAIPLYYYGYAKDLFDDIKMYAEDITIWQDQLLQKLKDTYLEGEDNYCNNKVPDEGIVLRKEGLIINPLKLKSERFKFRESKLLDDETNIDIEEIESNSNENM